MRKKKKRIKIKIEQEKATFKQWKTNSLEGVFFCPLPIIHPSVGSLTNQTTIKRSKGEEGKGKGHGKNLFNPPPLRLPIPLRLSF